MLKNKIILVFSIFAFAVPIAVQGEIFSEPLTPIHEEEVVMPIPVDTTEDTIEKLPPELMNPNSYKQPVSKKKIAKKFLLAMSGVAISSIILFILLSLYNKLRANFSENTIQPASEGEAPLETPDNLTDAVKTFLNKTKWN